MTFDGATKGVAARLWLALLFDGLAGVGAAAVELEAAALDEMSVLDGKHRVLLSVKDRGERHVVVGCRREVVKRLDRHPKDAVVAEAGRQKARAAFDGRIGMGEVRQIGDRHAVQFEKGMPIGDILFLLVVDHPARGQAPERRRVGIRAERAGREYGAVEIGAYATGAPSSGGGEQRIVRPVERVAARRRLP